MLVRIILTTVTYLLHISLEFVVNTTVSDDIILQWGTSTSPIAYPVAFSEKPINFLFHKTVLYKKVIVFSGADSPTLQYFDIYDVEEKIVYTNSPTVNYVAFGQS